MNPAELEALAPSGASALLGAGLAVVTLPVALRLAGGGGRVGADRSEVAWGLADLLLAGLAGIVALGAVAVLAPAGPETPTVGLMVRGAAVSAAAAAAAAALVARAAPTGIAALGLGGPRPAGAAARALLVWGVALPGLWGLGLAWPWLLERIGVDAPPPPLLERIAAAEGATLAATGLLAVILIPLFEEVLFRGFLQPVLVRCWGRGAGVLATSVLFAALHGPAAFGPVCGLSLVLGAVMLGSGRLWAPVAVHAANNALAILMVRALSDSLLP
ncbi:MAG: CPBP family intramembrane metalloprotease [Planctomycetota bacterium]|nr:CPBP family intramembrane metalloprotease [Planctomycetota bacterium]MDP6763842.1 CPBP family intramembrane metalloprotease [Planctomycetota bacterium]MDP6988830.1 CPBP family intramembrane metalloprotease [Planctomycetota bacterium]